MGNTIRKPRRRPRDESIAWRAFPWLLRREVVYQVCTYLARSDAERARPRAWYCVGRNYRDAARQVAIYFELRSTPFVLPRG